MQCLATRADVAQLVEQRFRKPQVTGSNPVVGSSPESFRGCHAVAPMEANRWSPNIFLSRATARQALDCESLESDDLNVGASGAACSRKLSESACRRRVER